MLNEIHNLEVLGINHNVFLISKNISSVLNLSVIHQLFQKAKHTSVIPWSLQGPGKRESQVSLNQPVLGEGPFFVHHACYQWEFCDILHLVRIVLFQGEGLSVHQYRPFSAWAFQVGPCWECGSHQL